MRRILAACLILMLLPAVRAHAQLVVIDPANLIQAVLIAARTEAYYEELVAEYETVQRLAQGLGNLDRYRIPMIPMTHHDAARWLYGRPWIEALNSGDAAGAAYLATAVPLLRPDADRLAEFSVDARRNLEQEYATIEISDSVAMTGGNQVGLIRDYHGGLQQAVQFLEDDVLSGLSGYHEMTAILDKVAAGDLLARRQDVMTNQLLSHALEQLLAKSKRMRDTEAAAMNMQFTTWREAPAVNDAFVAGSADALRTWRQP